MSRESELSALVERHRAEIEECLDRLPLEPEQVDDVLDRALTALVLRWEKITDRRSWLLDELDRLCLRVTEGEPDGPAHGAGSAEGRGA